MTTNFAGGSTKTLESVIRRHDGHADGHLNCVALRHGWSRTFSISGQELAILDYDTLEAVLEVNTLKLRPMGVRIFVEHPVDSGTWSKIRHWKHDGSLQSVLVQDFFERRRAAGTVTRLDIRDGHDRQAEGDGHSLRTVGSRIFHRRGGSNDDGRSNVSSKQGGWFANLSRRPSTRSQNARVNGATTTDAEDEDVPLETTRPPPPPPKPSFFSLLRPHPKIPGVQPQRRSIFDFFRSKLQSATNRKSNSANQNRQQEEEDAEPAPGDQQLVEVEQLRRRGWIPPGLARRQRSLKERLRSEGLPVDGSGGSGGSKNPFFGSNRFLSRAERKKAAAATEEHTDTDGADMRGDDPFGDAAGVNVRGPEELSDHEVDNFFEVERSSSMVESANGQTGKPWSRFKSSKDRKKKGKSRPAEETPMQTKGTLGGGADIVQRPKDAFPDSPYHKATNVESEVD